MPPLIPPPTEGPTPDGARLQGVVTYHDDARGFGKIHAQRREYFFHATACDGQFPYLTTGTAVQFTSGSTDKGPRASAVVEVSAAASLDEAEDTRGNR